MSHTAVVDFALQAREPDPPPALRRMRLVSRGLEILFLILALGVGLLALVMIGDFVVPYAGDAISLGPEGGALRIGPPPWAHGYTHHPLPPGYLSPEAMPVVQRLAQVPAGLLNAAPLVVLFWSLHRLFAAYARGVVFAPENARRIKHIGAALIVMAIAPWLGHAVLSGLHLAIDQAWAHASSLEELVLGAIVYVIAQVMQLGREIEEERSQFV